MLRILLDLSLFLANLFVPGHLEAHCSADFRLHLYHMISLSPSNCGLGGRFLCETKLDHPGLPLLKGPFYFLNFFFLSITFVMTRLLDFSS